MGFIDFTVTDTDEPQMPELADKADSEPDNGKKSPFISVVNIPEKPTKRDRKKTPVGGNKSSGGLKDAVAAFKSKLTKDNLHSLTPALITVIVLGAAFLLFPVNSGYAAKQDKEDQEFESLLTEDEILGFTDGVDDHYVLIGSTNIDYLGHITYENPITSVKVDDSAANYNLIGIYDVKYRIFYTVDGEDGETVITKHTTVVDSQSADRLANFGEVVFSSNGETIGDGTVSADASGTALDILNPQDGESTAEPTIVGEDQALQDILQDAPEGMQASENPVAEGLMSEQSFMDSLSNPVNNVTMNDSTTGADVNSSAFSDDSIGSTGSTVDSSYSSMQNILNTISGTGGSPVPSGTEDSVLKGEHEHNWQAVTNSDGDTTGYKCSICGESR